MTLYLPIWRQAMAVAAVWRLVYAQAGPQNDTSLDSTQYNSTDCPSVVHQQAQTQLWMAAYVIQLVVFISVTTVLSVQIVWLKREKRRLLRKLDCCGSPAVLNPCGSRKLPTPPEDVRKSVGTYLQTPDCGEGSPSDRLNRRKRGQEVISGGESGDELLAKHLYEDIPILTRPKSLTAKQCQLRVKNEKSKNKNGFFKKKYMKLTKQKDLRRSENDDVLDGYEKPLPNRQAPRPETIVKKLPQAIELESLLTKERAEPIGEEDTPIQTTEIRASVYPSNPTQILEKALTQAKDVSSGTPKATADNSSKTSPAQTLPSQSQAKMKAVAAPRPSIAPKPKIELNKTYENHRFIPTTINRPQTLTLASPEILIPMKSTECLTEPIKSVTFPKLGSAVKRQKSLPSNACREEHFSYIDMSEVSGFIADRLETKNQKQHTCATQLETHTYETINNKTVKQASDLSNKSADSIHPPAAKSSLSEMMADNQE